MTDPQSTPVSGEQHERAVEAASWEETMALGRIGSEAACVVIDAYLASLREQGVALVELGAVVEWLRGQGEEDEHGYRDHFDPDDLADDIERHFGGNERSEP